MHFMKFITVWGVLLATKHESSLSPQCEYDKKGNFPLKDYTLYEVSRVLLLLVNPGEPA
jgi:hypothetical protein